MRLLTASTAVPLLLVRAAPGAALEQRLIGAGGTANDLTGQSSAVEGSAVVAAGSHRALITAVNAGGTSKRRTASFKVAKPKRRR